MPESIHSDFRSVIISVQGNFASRHLSGFNFTVAHHEGHYRFFTAETQGC